MSPQESTFNKEEIYEFLCNTGNSFAALCWHNDITAARPTSTQTREWFQRYYADPNNGQFMYRLMECHCPQHMSEEFLSNLSNH